ncbi:hypothetical protein NT01EI_0244 [Edwardsiella ictaluri 93-146]|uniref:Uncharacterized protein n=1 Tax=Edwardsiella ictaluri (strain 93-146) TaxID=634503 RepID=C5BCC4_EDWI9|nr:hypothetical protein NT01EI_0244 [Edwardsiella ictaluri 93-146]
MSQSAAINDGGCRFHVASLVPLMSLVGYRVGRPAPGS